MAAPRIAKPPPVSTPRVSVVMAVHNGLPHVEASVRSILSQSFGDFEFVIGDDGSSDGTSEVLAQLAAEDRRIRLLRREQASGLAGSANWVVGEARAPLVAIMHADDRSYPERLARQVAAFEERPDTVLVGALGDGIDDADRLVRQPDYWRLTRPSAFAPFSHTSIMFRREAFARAGRYRPAADYWEDLDLYVRMAEHGRILVLPQVLASVRFSARSARLTNHAERVDEAIDLMYRSMASYLRGGDYPRTIPPRAAEWAKLVPETYIGRGSVQLWSGRSPRLMRRMFRRARLKLDWFSLRIVAWTAWSTLSPRTMRRALRFAMALRSRQARAALGDRAYVEWDPRQARRGARASAGTAGARQAEARLWPLRPL